MELNLLHYTFTGDVENDGKVIGGGRVEKSEGGSGGNVDGEGGSSGSGGNVGGERGIGGSGGNVGGEGGEITEGGRGGAGGRGRGRYKNSKSSIPTLLYLCNICVHCSVIEVYPFPVMNRCNSLCSSCLIYQYICTVCDWTSELNQYSSVVLQLYTHGSLRYYTGDDPGIWLRNMDSWGNNIPRRRESVPIWSEWKYLSANKIEEDKQSAVFLNVVGARTFALLRDLVAPAKPAEMSLADLCYTLWSHSEPKPIVIAERYYFHSRSQGPTESIAEFLAELR